MAKLTPGMKQDWKHRTTDRKPMNRMVRLIVTTLLFVALLGVLIWYLLLPTKKNTFFYASKDAIEYDLDSTIPLVHSSVWDEVTKDGNFDEKTFNFQNIFPDDLPDLTVGDNIPTSKDAVVYYLQAHAIRHDDDGSPRVMVAMPSFLRVDSQQDWKPWYSSGVLDLRVILDWIERANSPLKLVILDAGTFTVDGRLGIYENDFLSALKQEMTSREDRSLFVMTSHDDGQKSLSLSLNKNTIFSQAVQEAFLGEAEIIDRKDDDILSLDELYRHVCTRVTDHLKGSIPQTPRLLQGRSGQLDSNFPELFVLRYKEVEPLAEDASGDDSTQTDPSKTSRKRPSHNPFKFSSQLAIGFKAPQLAQAEAQPDPPNPQPNGDVAPQPPADKAAKPDSKDNSDPRWQTLHKIWEIREKLGLPPSVDGSSLNPDRFRQGIWSPIDFAPQEFQRLDDYLIGYQFRLLYDARNSPTIAELSLIQDWLNQLQQHLQAGTSIPGDPRTGTPVDNLIDAWNQFVQHPNFPQWTANLTDSGRESRNRLLIWNYCVYHVRDVVRLFELNDGRTADFRSFLENVEAISLDTMKLAGNSPEMIEVNDLRDPARIDDTLSRLEQLKPGINSILASSSTQDTSIKISKSQRLIACLRTMLISADQRNRTIAELRQISASKLPTISLVEADGSFLNSLATGALPGPSKPNMQLLRNLQLDIAALGDPIPNSQSAAYQELRNSVQASFDPNASFVEQVRSHTRVRALDWRNLPIVRYVPPLSLRFPVKESIPYLQVTNPNQTESVSLDRKNRSVPFTFDLTATDFPQQQVSFPIEYDSKVLELNFPDGSFNAETGILNYTIDADGPIVIKGEIRAKLDREQNARRQGIPDLGNAQRELVKLQIPQAYLPFGSAKTSNVAVSLPWAEEIDLVVQQLGAKEAGIFYGNRVQVPLFPNRHAQIRIGAINRSKIPRKVRVSLYPAVRPPTSTMPKGRIFSQQYHRKQSTGENSPQAQELAPWVKYSYDDPKRSADFKAMAEVAEIELAPVDQIPPNRNGEHVINELISGGFQWLKFAAPPGPPGPGGKPTESKISATDLSNGFLCVIEDLENKDANGKPIQWQRWIEWAPREPYEYLTFRSTVRPDGKTNRVDLDISPIQGDAALPVATWDSYRLFGFPGIPQDFADVPMRATWDWEFAFDDKELDKRIAGGTLNQPSASIQMGALLNLLPFRGVKRTLLVDIAAEEKLPTLRRTFRNVLNLNSNELDEEESAGFELFRLDSYVANVEGQEKPPKPIVTMATSWEADRLPIILRKDSTFIDINMSVSTDRNSFNYASEFNPDVIEVGILSGDGSFVQVRGTDFAKAFYRNRTFAATLLNAMPDGHLLIRSELQDLKARLSAKTFDSFVGRFYAEVRRGPKVVQSLSIPLIIDHDRPKIESEPAPIRVPINRDASISIAVSDEHSGIERLLIGDPGPEESIKGDPKKILVPKGLNITPNPNDKFQNQPEFRVKIRPKEFGWLADSTYELRVIAEDRVNLKSKPVSLVVTVLPEVKEPDPQEMPKQIQIQVLLLNGNVTTEEKYRPSIKDLPPPILVRDTWVFKSKKLQESETYTAKSEGPAQTGSPLKGEVTTVATPTNQPARVFKLKLKF